MISILKLSSTQIANAIPNQPSSTPISSPSPYTRPLTADNGSPFPEKSGYIKGYPKDFTDGYASVTIDNSQAPSDVFVKLFSLDTFPPKPVLVFFVKGNDKFTAKNIRAGDYDIRYRELDSGTLLKSSPFKLQEIKTDTSVRFNRIIITLYKVLDGNMQMQPIPEKDF